MMRIKLVRQNRNKKIEECLEEWLHKARKDNSNLESSFQKALESLRKYPLELSSGQDCILLQHFGQKLCTMIDKQLNILAATAPKPTIDLNPKPSTSAAIISKPVNNQNSDDSKSISTNKPKSVVNQRTVDPKLNNQRKVDPKNNIIPTENFTLESGTFDIVLLVDTSEKTGFNLEKGATKIQHLQKVGINYEIRHLNVGDFLWVARSRTTKNELVLPYIIERKRHDDFASSIKDGRFREQKFRLKSSGLPNIIYLIEGLQECNTKYSSIKPEVLSQAAINSLVQDNFTVKYSNDHQDSVLYLVALTRKLENLFKDKKLSSSNRNQIIIDIHQHEIYLPQFESFNKLATKNKVFTVGEMFIKQLLQLNGLSVERTMAIIKLYSTPKALKKAMDDPDFEKNLANTKFGPLKRKIGPAVAKSLYQLYTSRNLK